METRTFRTATLDGPTVETSAGKLTRLFGIAVPYDSPTTIGSSFVETFARGAFAHSIRATPNVPLLVNHDPSDVVGVATSWDERSEGLHGVWRIGTSSRAQEVGALAKDGLIAFLSVRFQPAEDGSVWGPVPRDGALQRVTRTKARLIEVSLVTTPAYAGATVTEVRRAQVARPSAPPPPPRRPAASHEGIDALSRLAQDLGDLGLLRAVQGNDADYGEAAALIRLVIEVHGPTYAPGELDRMAVSFAGTSHRLRLAGNLTRAASVVAAASANGSLVTDETRGSSRRRRPRG